MENKGRLWILGVGDPEMDLIEALLRETGERVALAVLNDGKRVSPREAYLAVLPEKGRRKVVLGGCGEGSVSGTEPVEEFLGSWASAQGFVEKYGDPIRGFAGAYFV